VISYFQALTLGLLQGISELFPISSLGHSVILPGILGWHFDQDTNYFLIFVVATHFATAMVLFVFYRKDWLRIISGIFRSLREREIKDPDAKLGWLLVIGTIPAGITGLLFEKQVKALFISPLYVAFCLAMNGVMLFGGELLRRKAKIGGDIHDADKRIAVELSWSQAVKVGLMQIVALVPGFSRTGATIAGGLLVGLSHEDALRYSFLLATPIIGAAALLKLPELLVFGGWEAVDVVSLGAMASAVAAYLSIKFLTKYFKTNTLTPFAVYCLVVAALSLIDLVR
jgi:undecaprenyl-diphosphatase